MNNNFAKSEKELFNRYTSTDLQKDVGLTPKQFANYSKAIENIYGLSLDKYREDPNSPHSNFRFNIYEYEIMKVLYVNIKKFPLGTTSKINYSDVREKALKQKDGANFTNYIRRISDSIDKIKSEKLRAFIYASSIYESSMEWLSAHDKLNITLSNFFQYTYQLNEYQSALLYRKLAYRIDELIFEVLREEEYEHKNTERYEKEYFLYNPANFKDEYAKRQWIKKNNPDDLDMLQLYLENKAKTVPKNSVNSKSVTLDTFLIEILEGLFAFSLESRVNNAVKEEKKKYKEKMSIDENELREKIKKKEVVKNFYSAGKYFYDITDGYYENQLRIQYAINSYRSTAADLHSYQTKLNNISKKSSDLSNNQTFQYFYDPFYKSLAHFSGMLMMNKERLVSEGIDKDLIDYLFTDLRRIYYLIDYYHVNRQDKPDYMYNQQNLQLIHDKFETIQNNNQSHDIISKNIDKVTNWSVSKKMYDNLESIKNQS